MAEDWRDEPRNRWREDGRDRPWRDYDYYSRARRGGDYGGGVYGRRDRDDDYATRGYSYSRGYGRGEYTGAGPRRGRWGREEDYGSGYRSHYMLNRGRDRDREDYGQPERGWAERAGDEVASWFGDERADRRRRMDALHDDEDEYRRGHGPYGRYRDDW